MFAQQSYFKSNIHRLNLKKFVQHVESLVKKFINTYKYYKLNVFQLFMTMPILWKKIFQLSKKVYGILNKGNQFHQRYHTERKCTTIISTHYNKIMSQKSQSWTMEQPFMLPWKRAITLDSRTSAKIISLLKISRINKNKVL